jgi:hypothetical protein
MRQRKANKKLILQSESAGRYNSKHISFEEQVCDKRRNNFVFHEMASRAK